MGNHDRKRLACLRRIGFSRTVDVGDGTLPDALAPTLRRGKFDVVIEATGAPGVVQPALDLLRKRGILVVCGIHPRPASIDLTRLVREQQQIRGSYRAPVESWGRVLAQLAANPPRFRPMITHRVPLRDALAGFELARA